MTELARKPIVLIVRDGWGHNPNADEIDTNAITQAQTPVDDRLRDEYPNTLIHTSGEDVGLPAGVMGNSEVGHQNIGAGRIVDQEIMRITRTVRDGSFFENEALVGAMEHAKRTGGSAHLMGLFSDGRVHSDMDHAYAIMELARQCEVPADRFFVHCIMDGRDTPPTSGRGFLEQVEAKLAETGAGRIASVLGRFWAMDRDNRWDRVERAYRLLTQGGDRIEASAVEAAQHYYDNPTETTQTGDEFITPTSIAPDGQVDPAQTIKSGDSVIFFNFRGDRPREITKAFTYDDAEWAKVPQGGFDRGAKLDDLFFVGMSRYEQSLPIEVAFERPPKMTNILGAYLGELGLTQFRSAETEKFAHVTFFFNDYREEPFPGEERELIPSPREVATYDLKPEMSAPEVAEAVVQRINTRDDDFVLVNFANGDMVGHTGSIEAAVKGAQAVDAGVGRIVEATLAKGGALVITADHGNCERMTAPDTGRNHTAHTTFDVPLIVVDNTRKGAALRADGRLADIAPTLLEMMGLAQPAEMTGQSLLPTN